MFEVKNGFAGHDMVNGVEYANPFQGPTSLPDGKYTTRTYYLRDPQQGDWERERYEEEKHTHAAELDHGMIMAAIPVPVEVVA